MGGALLVNLRSAWRVSPELTAYADVYNIGNRRNATWRYYNQQPRTVMLGWLTRRGEARMRGDGGRLRRHLAKARSRRNTKPGAGA